MVRILVLLMFSISAASAQAKIDGDELAAGILGFILGKLHEKEKQKHPDQGFVWEPGENVILKDMGKRLVMGTVVLESFGNTDTVRFPTCDRPGARNKRVRALQFRVDRSDAYVRSVHITYFNGERESVRVDDEFLRNQTSNWFYVRGGNRCIRQITVTGQSFGGSGFSSKGRYSALTFVGLKTNSF